MTTATTTTKLSFRPKQVTKQLLSILPERANEVLTSRFGLGENTQRLTLEAIGKRYGITRERVRQIENYALNLIRNSDAFQEVQPTFNELSETLTSMGSVVREDELLETLARDKTTQNHIHFLLTLARDHFKYKKEDNEFRHQWYTDANIADKVQRSLKKLYKNLSDEDVIPESELINKFLNELRDINEQYKDEEIARRWLSLYKHLDKNPLGEWGRADSHNIRARGIRDYAYMALKEHGSPMHFREIARHIEKLFNRKAHEATCHNELIKDPRTVLIGRGLYALTDWGYEDGVVRDVMRNVLQQYGPMTREELIDKVKKERHVKENTIVMNLQNSRYFRRRPDDTYELTR